MTEQERVMAFLKGLEELTRKTGVMIWGCPGAGYPDVLVEPEGTEYEHFGYRVYPNDDDPTLFGSLRLVNRGELESLDYLWADGIKRGRNWQRRQE